MREYVQSVLETIGLPRNTVQVLEEFELTKVGILYPNFFVTKEISSGLKDSEVLDEIEGIIKEHISEVTKELEMVQRYKRDFYGKDDTENDIGS